MKNQMTIVWTDQEMKKSKSGDSRNDTESSKANALS